MEKEKVYEVEFMTYTNCLKDTVSDWDGDTVHLDIGKIKYLAVGPGPFLVKESDLPKYQKFGQVYKEIRFVGYMEVDDA